MPACHIRLPPAPPASHPQPRPVITPYRADADGVLVPDYPDTCPWAEPGDAPCRVGYHHRRKRKTGPRFPLAVMTCHEHEHAFTLYPPGHIPYGRRAAAPCRPDGPLVMTEAVGGEVTEGEDSPAPIEPEEPAPPVRRPAWEQTVFEAALDAAAGRPWSRESPTFDPRRWRTQQDRLAFCAALLGVGPDLSPDQRLHIARQLDVPTLDVLEASEDYATATGYRERGRAIRRVLLRLAPRPRLAADLLAAGHIAGLWGRPSRWDPGGPGRRGVLRSVVFPSRGTGQQVPVVGRPEPPTTSRL